MSTRSKQSEIVVCDECGREVDRDSWSDGHVDVCFSCLTKPHDHAHGPGDDEDRCARCQERMVEPDELERRATWQSAIERLAVDTDCRRPEPWQVELAARILARPYRWSVTGRGDIWVMAQTTGSELGRDMVAAGRLDEWGNWPDADSRRAR
jgi:hypothetical protein